MNLCGGVGTTKEATPDVQNIVDNMKEAVTQVVSSARKAKLHPFKAVSYKTQVVAGTNYFIKVSIDEGKECLHLRVYKPLGDKPAQLSSHQEGHSHTSDIAYF